MGMDSHTKISDSPATESSVVTKGFTQIALGAAAGAFVAMRMNRGALLLSAGLAYALWKKNQKVTELTTDIVITEPNQSADSLIQEPLVAKSDIEGFTEWAAPEAPLQAPFEWATRPAGLESKIVPNDSLQSFFSPPVPEVEPDLEMPNAPVESAWDDLRAAMAPVRISAIEEAIPEALPVIECSPTVEELSSEKRDISPADPLVDMNFCQPSAPLVPSSMDEMSVQSGDMLMIDQAELIDAEEPPQSLFFASDAEFAATPQSLGITETMIVPKSVTQPLIAGEFAKEMSLSAPVVVPRDLQARKSFFDWLRG